MRGPDLTVGQRLALGFALPVLVLSGMTTTLVGWQVRAENQQQVTLEQLARVHEATQDLERALLRVAIVTREYAIAPDGMRLAAAQTSFLEARAALKRVEELPLAENIVQTTQPLRELVEDYLRRGQGLLGASPHRPDPARLGELGRAREATLLQLDELRALQRRSFTTSMNQLQEGRFTLYRQLLGALMVSLGFLAVGGIWTSYSLRRPILELLDGATAIEQGNMEPALRWTETLRPDSRSEIRRLARALGAAAHALQRRDRRVRADRRIADAAATTLLTDEIAREALAAIVEKMHAGLGVIYFFESEASVLKPVATHAVGPDTRDIRVGEGLAGQAARDRRLIVMRDIPADAGFHVRLGYDQTSPRCVAAAPIVFKDRVLGVVVVGALHNFDDYSLSFLESAAAQLAAGLQNSLAHAQLLKLAGELHEQHRRVQEQGEELQAQNEELTSQREELQAVGEEMQTQNEHLRELTDELTRADTRKNDFLALLAHELRNPLGAISNAHHILSYPAVAADVADSARQVIGRQTRQLTRLIDDLLDITRIVRGTLTVGDERLDLAALVRDCLQDIRPAMEQADMKLEASLPDEPLHVRGDPARLAQVVHNICGNAIKFRRPGGTLRVALRAKGRHAELRIADDGIGIDASFMPKIFEPFAQARPGGENGGGLGLGLSLVKALVDGHGGSVSARSAGRDQGAEFTIELPISRG